MDAHSGTSGRPHVRRWTNTNALMDVPGKADGLLKRYRWMPIMKAGGRPQKSAFDVRMKAEGCPQRY